MSPRPPSRSLLARWAVQYGPLLAPAARRLYAQGRFRQLAINHARTLLDGSFSSEFIDGERAWVVWSGDRPVASYPEVGNDLATALPAARPERRTAPGDLSTARARASAQALGRGVARRVRRGGAEPDTVGDPDEGDERVVPGG